MEKKATINAGRLTRGKVKFQTRESLKNRSAAISAMTGTTGPAKGKRISDN